MQLNVFSSRTTYPCQSLLVLCFLSLVLLGGCNPGPSLVQATGKITVDGQPANGAVLLFHPEGGASSVVSSGAAQTDGTFSLVTDAKPGIPAGNYLVTVTWPDPAKTKKEIDFVKGIPEPGPDLLKGRYLNKDRGIKISIDSGTTTIPPIDLKTK